MQLRVWRCVAGVSLWALRVAVPALRCSSLTSALSCTTSFQFTLPRSFLFKNQGYRFTDSEQQRLFQAIQLYVTMFSSPPEPDSPALALVQDALAMPFTGVTQAGELWWAQRACG